MQDSSQLDSSLKDMKNKAKKPLGLCSHSGSEDGTPALFLDKKEAMARKAAKEELKASRKSK